MPENDDVLKFQINNRTKATNYTDTHCLIENMINDVTLTDYVYLIRIQKEMLLETHMSYLIRFWLTNFTWKHSI